MATVPIRRIAAPFAGRLPLAAAAGVALFAVLVGGSLILRTRAIDSSFWMDEGLSVGIASHDLLSIPTLLSQDGSPPLYYMLLHLWVGAFGNTEVVTHVLSLVFALLTVPVGLWAGWSLFGKRAGWICAALAALNPFLTTYAQQTRMYTLVALLSLLTTATFLHAFVFRRRRYVPAFAVLLAALLYTHNWGAFFVAGALAAMVPCVQAASERRAVVVDGLLSFGLAGLLFMPWLPTLAYQSAHTGAPWTIPPRLGVPVQISRWVFGGSGATIALLLGTGAGAVAALRVRRSRDATSVLALVVLTVAALALAWGFSQLAPAWHPRYFGVVLGPMLLLASLGLARAGALGLVAAAVACALSLKPLAYEIQEKSNARSVAGEVQGRLAPGDLVVSTQPEQLPLVHYYLPGRFRYATTLGPARDPRVVDWRDAVERLRAARPSTALVPLLSGVPVGGHVLLVRPITYGTENWDPPWTRLVRRRSAQWGQALAEDPRFKPSAVAPAFYRRSTIVGVSAILYEKVTLGPRNRPGKRAAPAPTGRG